MAREDLTRWGYSTAYDLPVVQPTKFELSGPRYYAPAPVYVVPAPVYVGPTCYWTRGAPVWDGYRGIWYRPRIQVCD
jgi:hypothetical protein